MKFSQNGYLGELNLINWITIVLGICFILGMVTNISVGVYQMTDASLEQLNEVNATIELANSQPFSKEFHKKIELFLEDDRISKEEAEKILNQYEILKLKYEASK